MVITESELRELWRDGRNDLPAFPAGVTFTPSARDFLKAHNLQVRFEGANGGPPSLEHTPTTDPPTWDRPGAFPVVLSGPLPVCSECGQPVRQKPEHMTQLDAGHFAPKTAPRIKLRGRLDSLHALTMLAAAQARGYRLPQLGSHLNTLAAYLREVQSAEYNNRPVLPLLVAGKTEEEIHEISHWPEKHLGIAHIVPGAEDHTILHWLNYLRTAAREVEVQALETYPPPERADLARALNRLSSAVYYLELLFRSGELSWKAVEP